MCTERDEAVLIFDDTVQEKPYTDENEVMCWHYGQGCAGFQYARLSSSRVLHLHSDDKRSDQKAVGDL